MEAPRWSPDWAGQPLPEVEMVVLRAVMMAAAAAAAQIQMAEMLRVAAEGERWCCLMVFLPVEPVETVEPAAMVWEQVAVAATKVHHPVVVAGIQVLTGTT